MHEKNPKDSIQAVETFVFELFFQTIVDQEGRKVDTVVDLFMHKLSEAMRCSMRDIKRDTFFDSLKTSRQVNVKQYIS